MEQQSKAGKRVLIISYYWPPSGGAGVHRWLKLSKYLANNNSCFIYTPSNPDFALQDESLLDKVAPGITVLKRKIFEPYFIYRAFLKQKDKKQINQPASVDAGGGIIKRTGKWVRGNAFVPDPRVFWVKPSVKYLKSIITSEKIDVIISTGPPQSMHLIGLALKKHFGNKLNWIADFRDPWTNIDFYEMLSIGKRADAKHRKLEKEVIQTCDTMVTVSPSWGKDFEALGATNVKILTNGFDADDYTDIDSKRNSKFTITHLGSINADRNPNALWKALSNLMVKDADFKTNLEVKLVGNVHQNVINAVHENNLSENVSFIANMPHKSALKELAAGSISLLLLNDTKNIDGIIPGKLFEYMGVSNPILTIGKVDGDTGKIINENELGFITGFGDEAAAEKAVANFYESYKAGTLKGVSQNKLDRFSIKSIANGFEEIF